MVNPLPVIVWDEEAKEYLRKAIQYIRKDSPQNADKVKAAILTALSDIPIHPHKFPKDKYRQNNDGHFRAFEIFRFRISYYASDHEIRIVRIRHANQEPLAY